MKKQIQMMKELRYLYAKRNDADCVRAYFYDYVLYQIYSPAVIKEFQSQTKPLPFYLEAQTPCRIKELTRSSLSDDELSHAIRRYWVDKAVTVLSGYQNCPVPLSSDKRVKQEIRNLLSSKGEKRLAHLRAVQSCDTVPETAGHDAFYAANMFLLDMDLFVSLGYLKTCTLLNNGLQQNLTISLSNGCYNGCCHCGYYAKAPVSHMPYPIFAKLYFMFDQQDCPAYTYANSDPISYRDPIIGADAGDAFLYIALKSSLAPGFITKGHLGQRNKVALAKVMECTGAIFSFVDLPGERNVARNKERIKESVDVYFQVPEDRRYHPPQIKRYSFKEPEGVEKAFCQSKPSFNGAWVETWKRFCLPDSQKGPLNDFSDNGIVICSNGDICGVALNSETWQFDWQVLGSIYAPSAQKLKLTSYHRYIGRFPEGWQNE